MKNKKNSLIALLVAVILYVLIVILLKLGIIDDYYIKIIDMALISIILAVSLNLVIGFLGQLALGHAGFMAIGAYASAIITTNLKTVNPFILFPFSILAAGLISTAFAYIVGKISLRLKGDYLAIITLAFGEIIRNVITNLKITNGSKGYKGILTYCKDSDLNTYVNFTVLFIIAVITVFIITNLTKSRQGRAIISINEDEIASEASGINTMYYKIFAFCFSAFFAGIAGALYAHHSSILAASKFDYNYSIELAIIVVLGGMGNIIGSIVSAVFLTFLPQLLSSFESKRMFIYSILLISVMLIKNKNYSIFKIENIKKFFMKYKKA